MKNPKRSGRGGSYFQSGPDAERVLVEGTDQKVSPKPTKTPEAKPAQKAQSTDKGDE